VIGTSNSKASMSCAPPNHLVWLMQGTQRNVVNMLKLISRKDSLDKGVIPPPRICINERTYLSIRLKHTDRGSNQMRRGGKQPLISPNTNLFTIPNPPPHPLLDDLLRLENASPCIGWPMSQLSLQKRAVRVVLFL